MRNIADFDFELFVDPIAYQARGIESDMEMDIQMLRKYTNRIAVNAVDLLSEQIPSGQTTTVSTLSFNLLAMPHPECSFEWIRIVIDFSAFPGAKVEDYIPKSKKSDEPVKYSISTGQGLKFEATTIKLGPSYERKETAEHTVYFDEIRSGGLGSKRLNWDFVQQPKTKLHLDNLMLVKFSHDLQEEASSPVISLEARISIDGWKKNIPVLGSKRIQI